MSDCRISTSSSCLHLLSLQSSTFLSTAVDMADTTTDSDKGRRASQTTVDAGLASEDDAAMLAKLGYKQELRRNFTMIEVFGIAFSIMGLLPSIASTLSYSIPAGPAGMVWGWFISSFFIFFVGLAMADLGSAMPTSGGLYWFVFNHESR